MRKNVFGRKLKRDKNERKALFKSLMSSLVLHERLQITESKAKAIKPEIEKLVTKAKKNETGARLVLEKSLSKPAFDKMIKEIAPRFSKRQGGYTRLIKLGNRFGDDAKVVIMEWTESSREIPEESVEETKTVGKSARKTTVGTTKAKIKEAKAKK